MYGEECPICKLSQEYYGAKDEVNGKKYYKKRQYLAQALIVQDPLAPDAQTGETHEGKVRFISLTYQIYNIIMQAFQDDELEYEPYDLENGYDFTIKKTMQGKYASYTVGTRFSGRSRPLSEAELTAVEEHTTNLSTLLPKNPGVEFVRKQLNAEMNGGVVEGDDEDFEAPKAAPAARAPQRSAAVEEEIVQPRASKQTRVVEEDEDEPAPAKTTSKATESSGSDDVQSVVARIRERRNKANAA
jgi:hypothetical protein